MVDLRLLKCRLEQISGKSVVIDYYVGGAIRVTLVDTKQRDLLKRCTSIIVKKESLDQPLKILSQGIWGRLNSLTTQKEEVLNVRQGKKV